MYICESCIQKESCSDHENMSINIEGCEEYIPLVLALASPDLLEACKWLLNCYKQNAIEYRMPDISNHTSVKLAQQAINKAEGGE